MKPFPDSDTAVQLDWHERIPAAEWEVYQDVIRRARAQGIRFAVGGAFASAVYTGDLRNTKDFDFYLLPEDREPMKQVVAEAGLRDHYDRLPYDRSWIYRASRGDVIVDAIWAMANQRAQVDEGWLSRGPEIEVCGERLRAIPLEELIWAKLYVLQRERCDWPDVFNLLDARIETIDWEHLLVRLADDAPLLIGALTVYTWLAPDRASGIPEPVRTQLGTLALTGSGNADTSRSRVKLLDTRQWFHRHAR